MRRCGTRSRRAAAAALPLAVALTLSCGAAVAADEAVLYGDTFVLSGAIEEGASGRPVVVLARRHGEASYKEIARVRTSRGGTWRYQARPTIRTHYRARVDDVVSNPVLVDVEPRIVLRGSGGAFSAKVHAARSFTGKFVVLQRRTSGAWRTLRKLSLDSASATRFTVEHPPQRTQFRLFMPLSQVGPGYVAARSDVFTLFRR